MRGRHEKKIHVSAGELAALRGKLSVALKRDPHAQNGGYHIRSLYFDSADDAALRQKNEGVDQRAKYRIRFYNCDPTSIKLEKKSRRGELTYKDSVAMTASEFERILKGDIKWMRDDSRDLIAELYAKMRTQGFKPKTIVDYWREPFIFGPGNVRVTLDTNIRTSPYIPGRDPLSSELTTLPADSQPLMEVKWDAFLPDFIRDLTAMKTRVPDSFSKYAVCRKNW